MVKEFDRYYLVYRETNQHHTETIGFNTLEKVQEEFNRIRDGGKVKNIEGREFFTHEIFISEILDFHKFGE